MSSLAIESYEDSLPAPEGQFRQEEPLYDENSGVWLGSPYYGNEKVYPVPFYPHVFEAMVYFTQREVPVTETQSATLMVGHAHSDEAGNWKFADGRKVVDVVRGFMGHNLDKRIEIVAACNEGGSTTRPEILHVIHALGSKVIIGGSRSEGYERVHISLDDEENGKFFVPHSLRHLARGMTNTISTVDLIHV
jgi:hypothetical protein